MNKKIFFVVCIFLSFSWISKAEDSKKIADSAVVYYSQNKFDKTIACYEKILSNGYESPEIYFNAGNAYYKTKQYTKAILYYEKAKLLAPSDEDINFNLELSKKFVVDKIDVLPQILISTWLDKFTGAMSSDTWAFFSIITFILFLVLLTIYFFMRSLVVRKIAFGISMIFLFVSIITFICAYDQKKNIDDNKHAIVFNSTVNVKSSPDDAGTVLFVIHEGLKVGIQDKIGDWYKIKLSDGSVGWLKVGEVEVI